MKGPEPSGARTPAEGQRYYPTWRKRARAYSTGTPQIRAHRSGVMPRSDIIRACLISSSRLKGNPRSARAAPAPYYEVLTLEDGTTVKYEAGEKLEVLFAVLDRREHRLLPYLRAMDTDQGMSGLVRALEGGADGTS